MSDAVEYQSVELEVTTELLEHLKLYAYRKVGDINPESQSYMDECTSGDYQDLANAIGNAVLNEILVDMIKLGLSIEEGGTIDES